MNTFQKVIKYLAIAFAILLTVGILTSIVGIVSGVFSIFEEDEGTVIDYSMDFKDIEALDINHNIGKLSVKIGNTFRVEASNVSDRFRAEAVKGTLVIEEPDIISRFLWFDFGSKNRKSIITVYVPEDFIAKRINIDSGVGNVILENLTAERLIINAGVGDIYGKGLTAKRVDTKGGVGEIELIDVNFTDVDFESGVGDINVEGIIIGKSEIDCGIGDVKVRIEGARIDYALRINGGLGNIRVNGSKVSGEYSDSYNADNTIRIEGGIGNLNIDFSH